MPKSITVCIPSCLNNLEIFIELLLSISNQTMLPDQILVVVSGKDKTRKHFEKSIKELSKFLPKNLNTKFIISEKFGLSCARNIGIDNCKSDILIFGDDDDIWDKNKIYLIHQTILINGTCLVTHRFNNLVENKIKKASTKFKLQPNIFLTGISNYVGGGSSISGSTCIFKTLKFSENLYSCEDWDFWLRAYLISIPVLDIKKELVSYRVHQERMTRKLNTVFFYESLIRIIYLKNISLLMLGLILGFLKSLLKYLIKTFFRKFFIK